MSSDAYVKFIEDEDIYIECRPVDITGEVIMDSSDNMSVEMVNNSIIDSLTTSLSTDSISNNISFQTLIGIIFLSILYGIGNFVFKNIPKKIIDKKVNKY
tara:strand:+ start:7038 stop:7337 length:300 start_codon:yes stop_codon:yes gene_type:complete